MLKICKKYLNHVQRFVFEGNITELKLHNLKNELSELILPQFDFIIIYHLDSVKYAKKEQLGMFVTFLKYKLKEQGKRLVKVDQFFASSQTCNCIINI